MSDQSIYYNQWLQAISRGTVLPTPDMLQSDQAWDWMHKWYYATCKIERLTKEIEQLKRETP